MPDVLRVIRVFEVVDSAPVEQYPARVQEERARRLLGGPPARYQSALIVSKRKVNPPFAYRFANLLRRLSGPRGDHDQCELRMALGKTVEVRIVANTVGTDPGPKDSNRSLL